MRQMTIFDPPPRPPVIEPCDPRVTQPVKRRRLQGKARQVLALLRDGDRTNRELVDAVGHRFGGRISDLRKRGFVILCLNENHATGEATYRLIASPVDWKEG
jgi:hypothetical protein